MEKIIVKYNSSSEIKVNELTSNCSITLKDEEKIKQFFKELSKYKIVSKEYNSENDTLTINSSDFSVNIENYLDIRNNDYFDSITRAICKYNREKAKNIKIVKQAIAGVAAAVGLTTGVIISNSLFSKKGNEKVDVSLNNYSKEVTIDDISQINDNVISGSINITDDEIVEIVENDKTVPLYYDGNEIDNIKEENDSIELEKDDNSISTVDENAVDSDAISKTEINSVVEDDLVNQNISDTLVLPELNDYDDVIKYAASLFELDYNTAKKVVQEQQDYITGPKGEISLWMGSYTSLERIKDLKDKGIINPDIMKVGIFSVIRNYAYQHSNLNNNIQPCKLSVEDRERYILYIIENIYGVTDDYYKSMFLAVERVESHTGTSTMGKKKNNIGGNRSDSLEFDSYNTFEQGAVAYINSLLKNIDRTYYSTDSLAASNDIVYQVATFYCNETWMEWGDSVSERINYIKENSIIDKLEGSNLKYGR